MFVRIVLFAVMFSFGRLAQAAEPLATEPPIVGVAFSVDGESVIAVSQAGLHLHSWPELQLRQRRDLRVQNPHDIRCSANGLRIAVAGGTPGEIGSVEIVDWPSLETTASIEGHSDSIAAVAWVGDSRIATAGMDAIVHVWNIESERSEARLTGHSGGVTSLCFDSVNDLLISGSTDRVIRVWNSLDTTLQRSLSIHTGAINDLTLRPGKRSLATLASSSDDGTIRFWQPTIGRMLRFVRLPSRPLATAWSPDGSLIAVACVDGHLRLIESETVRVIDDVPVLGSWAYAIAAHPTDGSFVVGGVDGKLCRVIPNSIAKENQP